jgi:cytochrome P450
MREHTTINTVDPAEHAKKRKILNTCFTETSIQTMATFISKHIDRWNQLLLDQSGDMDCWSDSLDFAEKLDQLVFDVMGDLSFGRSFQIKEPGDNPLKEVPHNIAQYMQFYYPASSFLVLQAAKCLS